MNIEVVENPRRRKVRRRKTRRTTRRKRRNPGLSIIGNPRRRRRTYRRRRNPGLGLGGLNVNNALYTGVGIMVGSKISPLARKFGLPVPTGALWDSAAALVFGAFAAPFLKKFIGPKAAGNIAAGSIGFAAFNILNAYVAPMVGLAGVNRYIRTPLMSGQGVGRYMLPKASGMNGINRTIKLPGSMSPKRSLVSY